MAKKVSIHADYTRPTAIDICPATDVFDPAGTFPRGFEHFASHPLAQLILAELGQTDAFALAAPVTCFSGIGRWEIAFFSGTYANFLPNTTFRFTVLLISRDCEFIGCHGIADHLVSLRLVGMEICTVNSPDNEEKQKYQNNSCDKIFNYFFHYIYLLLSPAGNMYFLSASGGSYITIYFPASDIEKCREVFREDETAFAFPCSE
jgi:hypothetical protein